MSRTNRERSTLDPKREAEQKFNLDQDDEFREPWFLIFWSKCN
jgi:hypothetical protein